MPANTLRVTLGRTTLDVPVYVDEETTRALVERVNDRIAELEAHAKRIDSTAINLLTAFSFAADLHSAQEEHDQDTHEVTRALERLIDTLQ